MSITPRMIGIVLLGFILWYLWQTVVLGTERFTISGGIETMPLVRRPTVSSPPTYNFPALNLPANVIGCGGRRGPCVGGSEFPIPNMTSPIDISDDNIAPTLPYTLATRVNPADLLQRPRQVGVIYKVFGRDNEIMPLFGAKRYANDSKWDYYAVVQQAGGMTIKVPVRTRNRNEQLGNNDPVWLMTSEDEYRVTIYDTMYPI